MVLRSNGDGTFTTASKTTAGDATIDGYRPDFVDINGDGKTDIFWDNVDGDGRSEGQRIIWLSQGNGAFVTSATSTARTARWSATAPIWPTLTAMAFPTCCGAGRWQRPASGARVIWQGKGDGTFTVITNVGGLGIRQLAQAQKKSKAGIVLMEWPGGSATVDHASGT